ncbi:MAG TPA: nucleotidyltransferase [Myxococcaceae bacterium]|nr:nucleotidyltransferase [Myxococcaceae bacterium]
METVPQAFERFIQSLELTPLQRESAARQERVLADKLKRVLAPSATFVSGSYGRNTAIRPLHDIDLFYVLAPAPVPPAQPPRAYLQRVRDALKAEYQGKEPLLQNRSVNIEFAGTGIGFDIVPALEDPRQREVYWIPDKASGQWIRSNPRKHKESCDAANERAGKKLKPLVKAVKRWNQLLQDKPVPSFLMEVMAYEAFRTPPPSYAEGLAALFLFLSERITRPCPEPAGLGPPVDASLSAGHRERARQALVSAARKAKRALESDRLGHPADAHELWRELLGPDYRWR